MSTAILNPTTKTPGPPAPEGRRLSRRIVLISLAVLAVLIAGGGWLVYFSSVLETEQVTVRGTRQLTEAEVSGVAAVPVGIPLAKQDVDAIARSVTTLRTVQSVKVSRDWPHTVVVTVVERRPLLAVRQPGGFLVVDRFGIAYESRANRPAGAVIADVDPDATPVLTQVGVVASALPEKLTAQVSSIKAMSTDDISVVLESGVVVQWGSSSESPLKAQTVLALLEEKPRLSINVASPHNPAIR